MPSFSSEFRIFSKVQYYLADHIVLVANQSKNARKYSPNRAYPTSHPLQSIIMNYPYKN